LVQCAAACAIALLFPTHVDSWTASRHAEEQGRIVNALPRGEPRCCLFFGDEYEAAERALESRAVEPQAPTF
jgi:hypothetical protein